MTKTEAESAKALYRGLSSNDGNLHLVCNCIGKIYCSSNNTTQVALQLKRLREIVSEIIYVHTKDIVDVVDICDLEETMQ